MSDADIAAMTTGTHYDVRFTADNWSGRALQGNLFEQCAFDRCDLSRADLSKSRLIDCSFHGCDLTMVKLRSTGLQDVRFDECKLLGVDFSACNPMLLKLGFNTCKMDHAVLVGMKLKGIRFDRCSMQGTDLSGAELEDAAFVQCDLLNAVFERTVLRKADLTTAINFRIDPAANDLRGARFSMDGAAALLATYGIVVE